MSDSPNEQTYHDLASRYGISRRLFDALFNARDRQFVIKLEDSILEFMESNINRYKLSPMSSYCRLLAHQIAEYHELKHILSNDGVSVVVFKTFTPPSQPTIKRDDEQLEGGEKMDRIVKTKLCDLPIPNNAMLVKKAFVNYKNPHHYKNRGPFNGVNHYYNTSNSSNFAASNQSSETLDQSKPNNTHVNPRNLKIMKRQEKTKTEDTRITGGPESTTEKSASATSSEETLDIESKRASKEALYIMARERIYSEQVDEEPESPESPELTDSTTTHNKPAQRPHQRHYNNNNNSYNNSNYNNFYNNYNNAYGAPYYNNNGPVAGLPGFMPPVYMNGFPNQYYPSAPPQLFAPLPMKGGYFPGAPAYSVPQLYQYPGAPAYPAPFFPQQSPNYPIPTNYSSQFNSNPRKNNFNRTKSYQGGHRNQGTNQ